MAKVMSETAPPLFLPPPPCPVSTLARLWGAQVLKEMKKICFFALMGLFLIFFQKKILINFLLFKTLCLVY